MAIKKNKKIGKAWEKYKVLKGDPELQRLDYLREISRLEENTKMRKASEKGKARGKAEEKKETAKNMLKLNFSMQQITAVTGLTENEVEKLNALA